MYQTMDPLFVGLIFSVFQSDPRLRSNQVQLTCFQAFQGLSELERREVELLIKGSPMQNYNLEGKYKCVKHRIISSNTSSNVKFRF